MTSDTRQPRSLLFACNMNSVRSPMAASLAAAMLGDAVHVESAGVYEGAVDPFAEAVMAEIGHDISGHVARAFDEADPAGFDLVVALTPEAQREAESRVAPARVEFWAIDNPSETRGNREQVMTAYRATRDALKRRIAERFAAQAAG